MTAPSTTPTAGEVLPASTLALPAGVVPQQRQPVGRVKLPAESLLAMLAGMALLEQGFSPEQTAAYVAMGMRAGTVVIRE